MKISELWLREWMDPPLNRAALSDMLTMSGLEVESITPVAGMFSGVVIAHIQAIQPHPEATKLTICQLDCGMTGLLQVVCGAKNVYAGMKVALATIGAKLPGDLIIKETVLRGVTSYGMLCSTAELGLSEVADGILELDHDAPIGVDLRTYWDLDDYVLDINVTPNRADCLSVVGIAREISALTQQPQIQITTSTCAIGIPTLPVIENIQFQDCPKYCGRVLQGINLKAQTPVWMSERLRRSGLHNIHPVVDITNYVMLELGQPLHAFDWNQIAGGINVRYAYARERIKLLDGQDITLTGNTLVIADSEKVLAIAGVMGGITTSINANTTDILLESVFFKPHIIAINAREHNLHTDAAQRFERGVDPDLQEVAIERATELLLSIVGGAAGPIICRMHAANLPKFDAIIFNPERVQQITGIAVPVTKIKNILEALAMRIKLLSPTLWQVSVPTYRFDLKLEVDLIEEILRCYGYDQLIGEKLITTVQFGEINLLTALTSNLTRFFIDRGYNQTITYSFVDPELQAMLFPTAVVKKIVNPVSDELSVMRVSLWTGLLASVIYNSNRQQHCMQFFEHGVIFNFDANVAREIPCFAGAIAGLSGAYNWLEPKRELDFFDIKGDLQALFAQLHITNVQFIADAHPALHPGKTARIMFEDQFIGWCGVLHPTITTVLDCKMDIVLFELQLEPLIKSMSVKYRPISKFPSIRRDLSLLANDSVTAFQIEQVIKSVANTWLKDFNIFDLYIGGSIPEGKKSLAISLILQDDSRTLVDNEINLLLDAIINKLNKELLIILR